MAKNRKMAASMAAIEKDWQVQSDLETLCRAEEIEKDPKRMAAVTALAKSKMLKLAKVASEGEGDD